MLRIITFITCLVLVGSFFTACVPQSASRQVPEGYQSTSLGAIIPGGAFAVDPQARVVALARDGLYLRRMLDGSEVRLNERQPLGLAWSVDGSQLAAAFVEEDQSVVVFYGEDGHETGSSRVPGRITRLLWSPDGVLLGHAVRLHIFSFGTNLKAVLLSWKDQQLSSSQPLYDTTFKPGTLSDLGDSFYDMLSFDLSPQGDKIAYARLYDPPVIRKSLKIFQRDLSTGQEHPVYDLPLESGGGLWFPDNKSLLVSDGRVRTFLYEPDQEKILQAWSLAGTSLAVAPAAGLIYIDGSLFRDGQELMQLPSGPARFSRDGRYLLVARQEELVLHQLP